ncbi:BTB/POZ domain-containing protein At1g04390 isoform X2 [Punica granatum]|nr:BTB/POZ domain-containing protein At1g04390 isoform X2 [Punica granatum]
MCNIMEFPCITKRAEYIHEIASLLSSILWRWPQSRYSVWGNTGLMKILEVIRVDPDPSIKVAVLKICSSIALCGYGAKRILDNGDLLGTIVSCMGTSNLQSVQMEGFKLAQCIMMNEEGCSRVMSLYCEPTVKAIVDAMSAWRLQDGKVASDQMSLLAEACRVATITRWPGKHHIYFWKMGISKVLFDLLLPKLDAKHSSHYLSLEEQISIARESLNVNSLFFLRPYVWDILGSLAAYCAADFRPSKNEDFYRIEILLTCASLAFDDVIRKGRQLFLEDATIISRTEPAVRAVQMMIYSPCKYIASRMASILSEVLEPNAEGHLEYLVCMLKSKSSRDNLGMPELLQLAIHLICLTCYLALPSYQNIITSEGEQTMIDLVIRCLSRSYSLARQTYAFHLINTFNQRICCWTVPEEWEGRDVLLLYGLWGLADVVHLSHSKDTFARRKEVVEVQLLSKLREICSDPSTGGSRWFAAYILTYSGLFGFPSKLGEIISKAHNDNDFVDIQLTLASGEKLSVHKVLLMIRCPSLLPPKDSPSNDRISNDSAANSNSDEPCGKLQKEFTLSSHVGHSELVKLLDYAYCGYLHAEEDLLKKLKALAQSCGLQPLTQLLSRRIPKWGLHVPSFDLSPALDFRGQRISDVVLEAKATDSLDWTCTICSSSSAPHMHLHKVILWASCDYLRAMLQSGMLESHTRVVKAPIRWGALQKLVKWFYSYELPKPPGGCLWQNMGTQEKLYLLEPFIELLWLSEFWFLEEVHEECLRTIMSRLDSDSKLSVKVLQFAADLSQWKIVEAAANLAAGSFRQLQESGELESLDDTLVEMVRAASVRFSRVGDDDGSFG